MLVVVVAVEVVLVVFVVASLVFVVVVVRVFARVVADLAPRFFFDFRPFHCRHRPLARPLCPAHVPGVG